MVLSKKTKFTIVCGTGVAIGVVLICIGLFAIGPKVPKTKDEMRGIDVIDTKSPLYTTEVVLIVVGILTIFFVCVYFGLTEHNDALVVAANRDVNTTVTTTAPAPAPIRATN